MRKWTEMPSPKMVNDIMHCYSGKWLPEMDRCWMSDDGYEVTSRLLSTEWGNVEHIAIQRTNKELCNDGTYDIPWRIKQEIKNELFGEKRMAIEVFPTNKRLVDACDVYHLWVLPKDFELPFGIHPKDKQNKVINRGYHMPATDIEINKMKDALKQSESI